jgi:hypothetical protein
VVRLQEGNEVLHGSSVIRSAPTRMPPLRNYRDARRFHRTDELGHNLRHESPPDTGAGNAQRSNST